MKRAIKPIGILALFSTVVFLYVYFFMINKSHPDYTNMVADYKMQAGELYQSYAKNPVNANQNYTGKLIQIRGELSKKDKSDSLSFAIFVFNKGVFGDEGVRCTMLKDYSDQLSHIKKGSIITIKGFCSGYNETDVILEKCSIPE